MSIDKNLFPKNLQPYFERVELDLLKEVLRRLNRPKDQIDIIELERIRKIGMINK